MGRRGGWYVGAIDPDRVCARAEMDPGAWRGRTNHRNHTHLLISKVHFQHVAHDKLLFDL